MLGLTIDNLNISVNTNGGEFSCSIPLECGLNIIRAENSSGKSTCVNAIAYGLGLEAILGPSRKRPFPKSLYEEIFDTKANQNPFFVSTSTVSLDIRNSDGGKASLRRDISGNDRKISVGLDGNAKDYFLGASGQVGSAVSERGFHHWLADFIGWKLPKVVTFDGKEITLYLECIFPLFFVEQKRGWSEIQANIPTHYGIKNVKRAAAEFCVGIDSFEFEKKVINHKNRGDKAEVEWDKIIAAAEVAAEFNSVELGAIPPINKYQDSYNINFSYLEGDTLISVSEQHRSLKRLIERLSEDVSAATPDNEKLDVQNAILRQLRRELEEATESVEVTMLAVSEAENKIFTLKYDRDQYQQLRRLKSVGSSIEADLDTQKCPICESELYDTLGNRTVKRQPMTLEENIDFLKNQIDFFVNIRNKNILQLEDFQARARLVKTKIEVESEKLNEISEDINDVNGATKALLREKIQAEHALKEVEKLKIILDDLRTRAKKAYSQWLAATESLRLLRKQSNIDGKVLVINSFEVIIRANLASFQFSPSAISSISISHQTLRPEQEGYDIVAETSASDYIRIIWAYTLALMELAGKEEDIKHGGFVIFDEPRQHEASMISFANLIDKASESLDYNGQVIFATSLDEAELSESCKDKHVNLVCFEDYILTLKQEPEPEAELDAESEKNPDEEG